MTDKQIRVLVFGTTGQYCRVFQSGYRMEETQVYEQERTFTIANDL